VFDRLAVELADRENRKEPTKRSTGLLLQIVRCGVCRRPAYRLKGGAGRKRRYRCSSAQKRTPCANKSIPLEYADEVVEGILLRMLADSERLERVWDSGSDHSGELTEINETLTDLTGLLGSVDYRAGTPQRIRLNQRIAELATRQAVLSSEIVKPAGWTWQPTGEKFADWWDQQDTTARNVWLPSMNIRLDFEYTPGADTPGMNLDLGDLFELTQQMNASGPVADWQEVLNAMQHNGVVGIEINGEGIQLTPKCA
jgi:site-specific DNA recombinase